MSSKRPQDRRRSSDARAGHDRKARQLCAQVARTVESVLIGELGDETLRDLIVHAVEPAPDESRLLVTVGPCAPGIHLNPGIVMQHIQTHGGRIREEVAASITRRRTPTLIYQYAEPVIPPGTTPDEEPGPAPLEE